MQTTLIFIFYLVFFTWILCNTGFIKRTGLNKWWIIGLFALKVFAGIVYGWFYQQPAYFATSDTWHFFELSKGETDWLLHDPLAFFKDIFMYGYERSGNLFVGENSYWNDLKSNVIIKLLAICNVLTLKNYYANIVLFNFLFFFGPVALYRVVKNLFESNRLLLIAGVFLIPSFIFWCSGIHKDGLIFSSAAVIVFHFQQQLTEKKILWPRVAVMLLLFVVLFALRNFMALLLAGSLFAWLMCFLYSQQKKIIIASIVVVSLATFFLSGKISAAVDMPQYVIEKQSEFKQLSGASSIDVPVLENNLWSFVTFLPTAIDIALFRPHVTEIKNISYVPAAAEIILFWIVVAASLVIRTKTKYSDRQSAFIIFCIFFSFSFLLLAGYTITFSGAIVRYKAIVLPFLFVPVIQKLSALMARFVK
ncbi:hypothetical protein FRZ67_16160 [Panacibacter ginsenosidivorans]|uniref:Glycosyltransferase RgtA/B/C/D-like domain-containing protein n=1 Tax=Panacibacter ginsenosidivorans TaxID=1813871 RepID=A0A5B8VCN5_9BACT|nr:hypothetical protein [Panacibacter ginsenosidivorans]QEC68763.1 hypothetical protein FRZ67_16160 [Panacibacter ginsenosidivorans]